MLLFIPAMAETKSNSDIVKNTGMGVIYITFAKLWFLVMGWVLVFVLPRLFEWAAAGDAEKGKAMYGVYALVLTGVSFVNNGIVTGTIQSVSKFTAENEATAASVRYQALRIMGVAGFAIALLYALLSGIISKYWFNSTDDTITRYMHLSAVIILAYSCYSVFIGSLNGLRRFRAQALFDVAYTAIKMVLMIGFVVAGFEVLGTVLGFVCAAVLIAASAAFVTRNTPGTAPFEGKKFISFAWVIITYTFVLNLVMMADLYVLSGFAPDLACASGMSEAAAGEWMNIQAGLYKAVQQLAFIPYQAVISIAFVVFPLISKVVREADMSVARRYIGRTFRFTLILLAGLASVFCGVAEGAMRLVFPAGYDVASPALQILSIGIIAFGLLVISNTVLNAAGRKWHALTTVLIGMGAVLGLNIFFLSTAKNADTEILTRTASGTSIGMGIALSLSLVFIYREFKAFIPPLSLLRVILAAATAIGAAQFFPGDGKMMTLVHCIGVLIIFFGILGVTREFNGEDLTQLKQVLNRNPKQTRSSAVSAK
ncbi:MAG: polysaccharide biosynthesis C-terminal domain-containing protein [Deltaproteobacteria bacterium]|nr:polysaccharide biosynthesis C-terminal domain-containing protein [Deltaproteobacteria bacterium]